MIFKGSTKKIIKDIPNHGISISKVIYSIDVKHTQEDTHDFKLPTPTSHQLKMQPFLKSQWERHLSGKYNTNTGVAACIYFGISQEQAIKEKLIISPEFFEWMMGFPTGWTKEQ